MLDVSNDVELNLSEICFIPPKKIDNLYISELEKPVILHLPELSIKHIECLADNDYTVYYKIDITKEDNLNLIRVLYNLDEIALGETNRSSEEWFGKYVSTDSLEQIYIPVYTEIDDDIYLKCSFKDPELCSQLNSDNYRPIVNIRGLQFFKDKFTYIVDIVDKSNSSNENKLNLIEFLEDTTSIKTDKINDILNESIINELASYNEVNDVDIETETTFIKPNKLDKIKRTEVESIISTSRSEAAEYYKNANLADKAANNLRQKAEEVASTIKKYEDLLKDN